ncbi:MAG: HNH endonuclease [Acidimicrobiales bacterium]|nr:HNH endonuclease [Acidimicrobiales bacterium]
MPAVLATLGRAFSVLEAHPGRADGALPELGWDRLDPQGLRAAAAELQKVISAVEHQQRRLLALIDERRAFTVDGSRDAADWAANGLGVSRRAANDQLRLARQLDGLPNLAEAAARGDVSTAQARPAAQLADPTTDRQWAAQASALPVGVLDRQAAKRSRPTSADHRAARNARHFRAWTDGLELRFRGAMPVDDGHRLLAAIDRAAAPRGRDPRTDGAERRTTAGPADGTRGTAEGNEGNAPPLTPDQRRADGLLALAGATIADDADPDRANVVLIADLDTVDAATAAIHGGATAATAATHGGAPPQHARSTPQGSARAPERSAALAGATAELEDGTLLPVETARRLLCDSRVQVVVQDRAGIAVGVGTSARTVSPAMRRVIMQRDRGCRFGSCTATRFLQAHHVVPFPGPTVLGNLTMLCWHHHHAVHEGGWCLSGDPNGELRATRAGVTVTSHPRHGPTRPAATSPGPVRITAPPTARRAGAGAEATAATTTEAPATAARAGTGVGTVAAPNRHAGAAPAATGGAGAGPREGARGGIAAKADQDVERTGTLFDDSG